MNLSSPKYSRNKFLIKQNFQVYKESRSHSDPHFLISVKSSHKQPEDLYYAQTCRHFQEQKRTDNFSLKLLGKNIIIPKHNKNDPFNKTSFSPKNHFKLNKISRSQGDSRNKKKGKSIDLEILEKITKKNNLVSKLEEHYKFEPILKIIEPDFKSSLYANRYNENFKIPQKNEKTKNMKCFSNILKEEYFFQLIQDFYKKKMSKSKVLMKYFAGKNVEIIINNIGKFIFTNLFNPLEGNMPYFEYLEKIHVDLNITDEDFDTYKGLFLINMRENQICEDEVQLMAERLENYRAYIVKKLEFKNICCKSNLNFKNFLIQINEGIKDNGFLAPYFCQMPEKTAINHHNKLFSNICIGYKNFSLHFKKNEINKNAHSSLGINWKDCYEMKNLIINNLLCRESIHLKEDLIKFWSNLQSLHKFILNQPNFYENDINIFLQAPMMASTFCKAITQQKSLEKLFGKWSLARIQNHCMYIVEYITNSPKNKYNLCDLPPAHCPVYINREEFNATLSAFHLTLSHLKIEEDEAAKMMINFERTRYYISREKQLEERVVGNLENFTDNFIEYIYTYLLGHQETKSFYLNTDPEYIKYKQKLFFLKMFKNEIDSVDLIDLKAIHFKLGVKPKHFEIFYKLSQESLFDQKLDPFSMRIILNKLNFLKKYICEDVEN